jgi:hypothetical protein
MIGGRGGGSKNLESQQPQKPRDTGYIS